MSEAQFHCSLPPNDLLFRNMHSREELGRVPEFRLELLRPKKKGSLTAKELLGKEASVSLNLDNKTERYVHSLVTHFERGGVTGEYDIYRLEMRPWLWMLTLGADCRVFQDKTVVEILDLVFAEYGSASRVDKRLSGSFTSRPYTVQYRESDFNFISRLMEEEGIYYYFKHEKTQHTLVLCNGPSGHDPVKGDKLFWPDKEKGDQAREDILDEWSHAHTLQSLKYTSTDFAAEEPATSLLASAERAGVTYPKPNDLEVFDYPGGHDDSIMAGAGSKKADGEKRAERQVNRFESMHSVATGLTPYRPLTVGTTFSISGREDEKEGFLVTSSISSMEFAGYEASAENKGTSYSCRFNAVPKSVTFLPEMQAMQPSIVGPQTATVVGPEGSEIHTDKYGRVKLQFHWDRVAKKEDKKDLSSCWVRVSHPWASKQFGMVALPRVGDEVVVEFLEGNPDRPLVTGRVYNGTNMTPYTLPAQKTVSGIKTQSSEKGDLTTSNELRFEDKKGSEYVWFQAEKDYHHWVKNDAFSSIKNNLWTDVTKSTAHKVGENLTMDIGKVTTLAIGEDTHAKIGADLNLAVKGALNAEITSAVAIKGAKTIALTSGSGMDIDAGMAMKVTAKSGLHLKGMEVIVDAGLKLVLKCGSSFITLGPEGVTIQGTMVKINCGGSGTAANAAAKASPAAPKEPEKPTANKDPLAKDSGGSGGGA